jgi:hypothetical protein
VALDSAGNLYVADSGHERVLEFPNTCAATGCSATRVFGQSNFSDFRGGTSARAIQTPQGVAVDSGGNVYVADGQAARVLEFPGDCAPTGCSATHVYGQTSFTDSHFNAAESTSTFRSLSSVAVDSSGNLYVGEVSRVLEFQGSCEINGCSATHVYSAAQTFPAPGTSGTPIGVAHDIAVGGDGKVYFADSDNNRVLGGLSSDLTAAPSSGSDASSVNPTATPAADISDAKPTPTPVPDASDTSADGVLSDSARADILAAVDNANTAWSAAQHSLDPADLQGAMTGQELTADSRQLAELRNLGQTKEVANTAFAVVDVVLDNPTEATVHTRESWSEDVHNLHTGDLLRHDGPTDYSETYTVDLLDGRWIVSQIDLQ